MIIQTNSTWVWVRTGLKKVRIPHLLHTSPIYLCSLFLKDGVRAGMPYVLGCVKSAEVAIMEAQNEGKENKEYLPIEGSAGFNNAAATLALGSDDEALGSGRVTTVQALSGTGALTVGAHFLRQHYSVHKVLVPSPTWGNHNKVFPAAGLHVEPYPYFDYDTNGLDLDGMLSALRKAEEGSIVLLHACAHNPTGVDPSEDQWRQILQTVRERKLLPFFDVAYQGFASGDLDRDAFSLRLFASCGIEMLFAQSFAKNMGLYGERVGALSVVTSSPDSAHRVKTQLKSTIRPMYSSPPVHGASIARYVLSDPELFALWQHEMSQMAERIASVRRCLSDALRANDCPGDWSHILQQIGMFSFTGLTKQQVS